MEKKLFRRCFTLVEVLIAMGICVIGICSIMVFFPVGANASRNAAMSNATSLAADQILTFVRSCIESDTGTGNNENDWRAFRYFTGWKDIGNPGNYTAGAKQKPGPEYRENNANTDLKSIASNGNMGDVMKNAMATILKNDSVTVEPLKNNVFYIDFSTKLVNKDGTDAGEASDYNCYASLWAEPVEAASGVNIPFAARIHLELSWPADIPYEKRQTREFSTEVFRPY